RHPSLVCSRFIRIKATSSAWNGNRLCPPMATSLIISSRTSGRRIAKTLLINVITAVNVSNLRFES
ncbi:unnamed protein product, partial [Nesidiocoris tenuis]